MVKGKAQRYLPEYRGWTKTGVKFATACGSRDVLDAMLVRPDLVA
ncbi:hypothetical protein [Streptomyces sp. WM6372]|nr:hypothetical protein [Streptomyces sp. WM6372]